MRILFLTALLLVLAAPAWAAVPDGDGSSVLAFTEAESEEGGEAPPTTQTSQGGITPAEMAPAAEDEPPEDQWTAKFLAPLVAVLGVIGIVVAFILYGLRLRGRYRVVE